MYTTSVNKAFFPYEIGFMASLIIINIIVTPKGLAMINGAAMPRQLTVKLSYTSASTKALRSSTYTKHGYHAA
jgi:hypothetical protein